VRLSLNTALNDVPKLSSATAENMLSTNVRVWFVMMKSVMISAERVGDGCHGFQVGEQDAGAMQAPYAVTSASRSILISSIIALLSTDTDFEVQLPEYRDRKGS